MEWEAVKAGREGRGKNAIGREEAGERERKGVREGKGWE